MTAAARPALTRPPRLRPGDRVAVVATSGPVPREQLDAGMDILRGWDLDPVPAPHVLDTDERFDHLAGADADRARDFQEAWCDPSIAAVFGARGGYGAQRIAELLDWDALRAAGPKLFLGYSDLTVLHSAIASRLGLATLYGPMPATESFRKDSTTQEALRRTLFEPDTVRTVTARPGARTMVHGQATGTTIGGCAALLSTDLGTPSAHPSAAGSILLLEDVGEEPYSLDRVLTQLLRSGWLDGVAGIALGSWHACGPYETVRALILDRLAPLGVPIVEEFGFGHGPSTLTLPLGVTATLDADAHTLTYEAPALT